MKRALISVSDKTGIVELAKSLVELGWSIVSTGGTYRTLSDSGVEVTEVCDVTKFPEILDGRVKTLHPSIHGGILYRRDDRDHVMTVKDFQIDNIDMVVVNLYPFKEAYEKEGLSTEEMIEEIDIGGPTLIRAAAKNFKYVNILVDHKDYSRVLEELNETGHTSYETRIELAKKAFAHTARYDSVISRYFNELTDDKYPENLILAYEKKGDLRYGENPHQEASLYQEYIGENFGIKNIEQLGGKELSYNNINDINEALNMIREFEEPTAIAVKHGNPCGAASSFDIFNAYQKAHDADPQSIFGGIVIFNREVDLKLAEELIEIFLEIVIAPSFTDEALEVLRRRKNLRVISLKDSYREEWKAQVIKGIDGGLLMQDKDSKLLLDELQYVTDKKPSEEELEDMVFAWKIAKCAKSNGVVIARDKTTIAIGPGQVSRVWALENAIKQGGSKVEGSVLASDAFFPFSDCVEIAAKSGITSIIQPGGSIHDENSIKKADKTAVAMVFTGIRHFKH